MSRRLSSRHSAALEGLAVAKGINPLAWLISQNLAKAKSGRCRGSRTGARTQDQFNAAPSSAYSPAPPSAIGRFQSGAQIDFVGDEEVRRRLASSKAAMNHRGTSAAVASSWRIQFRRSRASRHCSPVISWPLGAALPGRRRVCRRDRGKRRQPLRKPFEERRACLTSGP